MKLRTTDRHDVERFIAGVVFLGFRLLCISSNSSAEVLVPSPPPPPSLLITDNNSNSSNNLIESPQKNEEANAQSNRNAQNESLCVRLDANCLIEDENDDLVPCEEFKYQPPLLVENYECMRDVFISGTITNIFSTVVITSYNIDNGKPRLSTINTDNSISIGNHYKEIDLCDIRMENEDGGEVDIFTIRALTVWRPNSSSSPIQCKEEQKTFSILVEEVPPQQQISDHPSTSPSEHSSVHPSFHPSSNPTEVFSLHPTINPTETPSLHPTMNPTEAPSSDPTKTMSLYPTIEPTNIPSDHPSSRPVVVDSDHPSLRPTIAHTEQFSMYPSSSPTENHLTYTPSAPPYTVIGIPDGYNNGNILSDIADSIGDDSECGHAIDISHDGKDIIIGCPRATINGKNEVGTVFLYHLSLMENQLHYNWEKRSVNVTGDNELNRSGMAVSFAKTSPDVFAVGEPYYDKAPRGLKNGRVRVFQLIGKESTNPSIRQIGSDILGNSIFDFYGSHIDLSNDGKKIAVSASPGISKNRYVDVLEFVGGDWQIVSRFKNAGTQNNERFGASLSMSNDGRKIGIGSIGLSSADRGRAEVFMVDSKESILSITTNEIGETYYGESVSISDNYFAVGSPNFDCSASIKSCGRVQIFDILKRTDPPIQVGNDIKGFEANDDCGKAMSFSSSGNTVIIGCNAKAIVASLQRGEWIIDKILFSTSGSSTFGHAIAISDVEKIVAVGDPSLNSVQVFEDEDTSTLLPSQEPSLSPSMKVTVSPAPTTVSTTDSPIRSPVPSPSVGKGKDKSKGKSKKKKSKKKSKKSKKKDKCKKKSKKKSKGDQVTCEEDEGAASSSLSQQQNTANARRYWVPAVVTIFVMTTMIGVILFIRNKNMNRRNMDNDTELNMDNGTESKGKMPQSNTNYSKVDIADELFPVYLDGGDYGDIVDDNDDSSDGEDLLLGSFHEESTVDVTVMTN